MGFDQFADLSQLAKYFLVRWLAPRAIVRAGFGVLPIASGSMIRAWSTTLARTTIIARTTRGLATIALGTWRIDSDHGFATRDLQGFEDLLAAWTCVVASTSLHAIAYFEFRFDRTADMWREMDFDVIRERHAVDVVVIISE